MAAPEHTQSELHESTEYAKGEAHGSGGLPQFQFEHWAGQIVWLLIIFAITFALLSRVFVPKMRAAIEARRDKIAGDLAEARALRDQAEQQAAAAQQELNEARGRAQKTAADARAKSQAEASARQAEEEARLAARLAEAETRIQASRDQAMTNVRTIAADTTEAVVAKLTGQAATADEIQAALA